MAWMSRRSSARLARNEESRFDEVMAGRRGFGALSIAAGALMLAGGCGGTAEYGPANGGSSGDGAISVGGSGGRGGSAGTGGGGFGGIAAQGGKGGSGGCVSECGVDGAPCCNEGEGCGFGGPNGSMSCNCQAGFWRCTSSVGGIGGTAGFGGSFTDGGCNDPSCGPTGAPCCNEGSGCAYTDVNYSCECTRGQWQCTSFGSGGTGGSSGTCNVTADCFGAYCCGGRCVNQLNDIYNCGGCGVTCEGLHPFCSNGRCASPPCSSTVPLPAGTFCCGDQTCANSQLCCQVQSGGPSFGPICHTPTYTEPSCPVGCPLCL